PELVEEEVKGAYLTVLGQELERADPLAARIHLAGEPDPRLLRVLDRVCHAPAIHLTLAALAADCGASVRTLNRLFLQQLGCSFRQWREQVVLGRARQLQHRGLTLAQIADRLGYEDPGALSRALQRLARREPAA
ncbi:helix-turn-helix transcriptional regulator, partial [Aeromonas caviae]